MASFPAQLALSALVMTGVVTGLYFVGQHSQGRSARAPDVHLPSFASASPAPALAGGTSRARALLPARSWLVVDFDGSLTGSSPFADSKSDCTAVPPPARVGLSIVGSAALAKAPDAASEGMVLLLASPAVSPEFWRCVRAEVMAAGGRALPADPGEERLESPSGVLVQRAGQLLFASEPSFLDELVLLARGDAPQAAVSEPHASLAASIPGSAGSVGTAPPPLLATLRLPDDWLSGIGPEAGQSPLRHLTAGALRAEADGSAGGTLECREPGCEELAAFLIRARADLGASLPGALGEATSHSWSASREPHPDGARGLIRLRWVAQGVSFADWVSGVWRATVGGAALPPAK